MDYYIKKDILVTLTSYVMECATVAPLCMPPLSPEDSVGGRPSVNHPDSLAALHGSGPYCESRPLQSDNLCLHTEDGPSSAQPLPLLRSLHAAQIEPHLDGPLITAFHVKTTLSPISPVL